MHHPGRHLLPLRRRHAQPIGEPTSGAASDLFIDYPTTSSRRTRGLAVPAGHGRARVGCPRTTRHRGATRRPRGCQFFVLDDAPALAGDEITTARSPAPTRPPTSPTSPSSSPTRAEAFGRRTREIAQRGADAALRGQGDPATIGRPTSSPTASRSCSTASSSRARSSTSRRTRRDRRAHGAQISGGFTPRRSTTWPRC